MITSKQISNILQQPASLHQVEQQEVDQWLKSYPYFSLLQHLQSLHAKDAQMSSNIRHLYPTNPVLAHILQLESLAGYQYSSMNEWKDAAQVLEDVENQIINSNIVEEDIVAELEEQETTTVLDEEDILATADLPLDTPVLDYFSPDEVSNDLPEDVNNFIQESQTAAHANDEATSLMRVMSFTEWLSFLSVKNQKEKEEEESKKSLKLMWQKEKLSKAIEEETEEIPEQVFNMAVNSIAVPEDLHNESMAEVYIRQGKYTKAIDIYKKLSLLQPEKNIYFASKIENLKKEL